MTFARTRADPDHQHHLRAPAADWNDGRGHQLPAGRRQSRGQIPITCARHRRNHRQLGHHHLLGGGAQPLVRDHRHRRQQPDDRSSTRSRSSWPGRRARAPRCPSTRPGPTSSPRPPARPTSTRPTARPSTPALGRRDQQPGRRLPVRRHRSRLGDRHQLRTSTRTRRQPPTRRAATSASPRSSSASDARPAAEPGTDQAGPSRMERLGFGVRWGS